MSVLSRSEVEAMSESELIETVIELSETVHNLEVSNEVLIERVNDQADRIDDLEGEVQTAKQQLHSERAKLMRRVSAIEDDLGIDATTAVAVAEGGHDGAQMSKLARLMRNGPDAVVPSPKPKHRRAKTIVDNFDRWGETQRVERDSVSGKVTGTKTWILKTAEHDLKTRLEDARNESLQWTQVYRALEVIAEWSDAVRLKESAKGKTLTLRVEAGDQE